MAGVRDVVLVCGPGLFALGIASAQAAPPSGRVGFTAGVGAMYGNLMGGDFTGSKAAAGVDANAGVVLHRWQLGIGYDRTNHRHDGTDGDYIVSNAYVEPRLLFPGARAMDALCGGSVRPRDGVVRDHCGTYRESVGAHGRRRRRPRLVTRHARSGRCRRTLCPPVARVRYGRIFRH